MAAQAQQDQSQQTSANQSAQQPQTSPSAPNKPKKRSLLAIALVLLFLLMAGGLGYLGYQNYQLQRRVEQLSARQSGLDTLSPTQSPTEAKTGSQQTYTFQSFSIKYPEDWEFMQMSKSDEFPLRDRIIPTTTEAIAIKKGNIYMIVSISDYSTGGAGGIFIDDEDRERFILGKDRLEIDGSVFYLSRQHHDIDEVANSESGLWSWGTLFEYIPDKQEVSGELVDGYEQIVIRDEYAYNFFVVADEEGINDTQTQQELIEILSTADW